MGTNNYSQHVHILPEDDANRELANGFSLWLSSSAVRRQIQVLPVAGGWIKVLEQFAANHVRGMEQFPKRFMVLLIDFDREEGRLERMLQQIPANLKDRVFILGSLDEPRQLVGAGLHAQEDLDHVGSKLEAIGYALARDCSLDADTIWGNEFLSNNAGELARMRPLLRPILFQPLK